MPCSEMIKAAGVWIPATVRPESNLNGLPTELFNEIVSRLGGDVNNFRAVCSEIRDTVEQDFLRAAAKDRCIYARYASVASFLSLLRRFPSLVEYMSEITVVADGFKEHEYRSEWAWEDLAHKEGTGLTSEDNKILDKIDFDHANEVIKANAFIYSGGYRTMLGDLLGLLPSTFTLTVRKLNIDEHIPGWSDTEKIKQLSFYRPGLDTKEVYYGDWQYDTVHHRVTTYTDEYGEDVVEPGAGPQASFIDDLNAALTTSGFAGPVVL